VIGAARAPCDEGVIRGCAAAGPGLSKARGRLVLLATVLASSMAFIDSSVVNVALPAIQRELNADGQAATWVMNGYLLLLAALVLIGGAAADRFGRRRVLVVGVIVFAAASAACGLAPDVEVLIAARAVQGAGAALLTPASLAILGSAFQGEARGQAIGAWAGFGAVMAAIGPVLGGWLVDWASWRAIFFINLPIAAVTVILALAAVPESREPEAEKLDVAGALLVAAGLGLLSWGLTSAPAQGFAAPAVTGAVIAGVVWLTCFAVWEARTTSPMVPPQLFASLDFTGANILTLLLYFALGGALFFLPFELIRAHGYSATAAGAALTPFSVVMGLGSPLAGRAAARFGARGALTLGPAITAVGLALLGLRAGDGRYLTGVLPGVLVLAVGLTLSVAPLTDTVMASVAPEHAGKASGINNAAARLAGLLAVAAMSLVFAAWFDSALDGRLADAGVAATARPPRGQALAVQPLAARGPLRTAEQGAFEDAYRAVMLLAAGCALAGGAAAWLTIGRRPDRSPRRS
jgi:EmrB/QacA subfamily drug resistance transporter